jgi:hypothetical protein
MECKNYVAQRAMIYLFVIQIMKKSPGNNV